MASGQAHTLGLKVSGESTLFSVNFPIGVPFQPVGFVLYIAYLASPLSKEI